MPVTPIESLGIHRRIMCPLGDDLARNFGAMGGAQNNFLNSADHPPIEIRPVGNRKRPFGSASAGSRIGMRCAVRSTPARPKDDPSTAGVLRGEIGAALIAALYRALNHGFHLFQQRRLNHCQSTFISAGKSPTMQASTKNPRIKKIKYFIASIPFHPYRVNRRNHPRYPKLASLCWLSRISR